MSDSRLANLKLVAFDVDGVFTDGRFYLSDDGVESKAFHTQDGYGIRRLIESGIAVAVISGRRSGAVDRRMQELGVSHVVQGCRDKVAALDEIADSLGIAVEESAYVGDDIPDLAVSAPGQITYRSGSAYLRATPTSLPGRNSSRSMPQGRTRKRSGGRSMRSRI